LRSPTAPTTSTTRNPDVTVLPGLTDEDTSIMKEPQLFELRFGWPQRSQMGRRANTPTTASSAMASRASC
jgi:hypothetical protein